MKNLVIAAVVIAATSFTSCTKEKMVQANNIISIISTADDATTLDVVHAANTRMDIGQADVGNI